MRFVLHKIYVSGFLNVNLNSVNGSTADGLYNLMLHLLFSNPFKSSIYVGMLE